MRKLKNSELNRIDISTFKSIKKTPLIVVLDDIRSLNNVGSIFRTCDAFKIEKLYLCGITATPPNRKITKTAIGATESVEWVYKDNIYDLISELKNQGFKVWAIEQTENSKTLSEIRSLNKNAQEQKNELEKNMKGEFTNNMSKTIKDKINSISDSSYSNSQQSDLCSAYTNITPNSSDSSPRICGE